MRLAGGCGWVPRAGKPDPGRTGISGITIQVCRARHGAEVVCGG